MGVNYGDYFGQDWNQVRRVKVEFVDEHGKTRGTMLLEADDAEFAMTKALDFQLRFHLFRQYGSQPLRPVIRDS